MNEMNETADAHTPQIGPPDTDHRAICAYEPPGKPRCQNNAEIHLLVEQESSPGITITLATCQQHHRVAMAAGPCIDEHEHRGFCGLPGTVWIFSQKRCDIDDSATEPAVRELATSAAD